MTVPFGLEACVAFPSLLFNGAMSFEVIHDPATSAMRCNRSLCVTSRSVPGQDHLSHGIVLTPGCSSISRIESFAVQESGSQDTLSFHQNIVYLRGELALNHNNRFAAPDPHRIRELRCMCQDTVNFLKGKSFPSQLTLHMCLCDNTVSPIVTA